MANPGAALRVIDAVPAVRSGGADGSPQRERIVDAALSCLASHGTTKTTVDDIARAAGLSRATVYRVFPGGRDQVLASVVDTEMARLFSALGVVMGGAATLDGALVAGIVEASTRLRDHAALRYLAAHEPEVVLAHLAFDESDRLLDVAARFTAPFLARWMAPAEAERVAEWATRIVLSYATDPSPTVDPTDRRSVTALVDAFVMPGVRALQAPTGTVVAPFATDRPTRRPTEPTEPNEPTAPTAPTALTEPTTPTRGTRP